MAWFRVHSTEEQQRIANEERVAHPELRVREKMRVLWLLQGGSQREEAAEIVGVSRTTVHRYVAAFRAGGLERLRSCDHHRPRREMAAYRAVIRESFAKRPVHAIAQACDRIFELTGRRRGPSQVREFLTDMGLTFHRARAIPVPPRTSWPRTSRSKRLSSMTSGSPVWTPRRRGKAMGSSSTRPLSSPGRSCATCGRSRGSSFALPRAVNGSMSWVHGTR